MLGGVLVCSEHFSRVSRFEKAILYGKSSARNILFLTAGSSLTTFRAISSESALKRYDSKTAIVCVSGSSRQEDYPFVGQLSQILVMLTDYLGLILGGSDSQHFWTDWLNSIKELDGI